MQDKLLCKFNLFDLDQKIYLYSSVKNKVIEIGTCATENVGDMIVSLLINKPSIGEIELSGNASYAQKTLETIRNYQSNEYNFKNVRISINGKVFN